MYYVTITIRNNSFVVSDIKKDVVYDVITMMDRKLTTYTFEYNHKLRRRVRVPAKKFYVSLEHIDVFVFSITILKNFIGHLLHQGMGELTKENIEFVDSRNYKIDKLNLKFNKDFKPRGQQQAYINAIVDANNVALVDLRPGSGKSFIASKAVHIINEKTLILVLPKYIEKWIDDVKKYFTNIKDEEIFVVRGGDSLAALIDNPKPYKFIIASIRTMVNYIKDFEKDEFMYQVDPFNLIEHLKVGNILNDESHQEYHAVFRCMMYFNAKKLIGLSATLVSDDNNLERMYKLLYPEKYRITSLVNINKYTIVRAIIYKIESTNRIRYTSPQGYNHIKFEQSIMRSSILLKDYTDMINYYLKRDYTSRRKQNNKCLIFCASINMCTYLTNHLAKVYKDLDVRRYVEDDTYDNILEADICVSTNLSAGVALDIPGLITVIQTVSIGSMQANIQALGRLREIEDTDVIYDYLYTNDIEQQVKLEKKRRDAIKPYAKEYHMEEYPKLLKTL